jgi:peptide chain release factor subunit 1
MGAVDTIIVWDSLQEPYKSDASENDETELLVDWLTTNFKKFGCKLEIVSNKSQEGSQFARGFGGIGGLLRYKVDMDRVFSNNTEADDLEDFI